MSDSAHGSVQTPDLADVRVQELAAEVRGAVVRLHRRLRFEKADDPLGETASSVLSLLAKRGARTLKELSEHEHVTPPAMNQTMNSLAASGLVVREPDPSDGRKVLFVATSHGVQLAAETRRRRHAWLVGQLHELSPAQQASVLEAARILGQVADS
jgi:DNA-binding MarR family transcriptional regulator